MYFFKEQFLVDSIQFLSMFSNAEMVLNTLLPPEVSFLHCLLLYQVNYQVVFSYLYKAIKPMSCPVQIQWAITDSFPLNYMLHWVLLDWKYSLVISFVSFLWSHPSNIRNDREIWFKNMASLSCCCTCHSSEIWCVFALYLLTRMLDLSSPV